MRQWSWQWRFGQWNGWWEWWWNDDLNQLEDIAGRRKRCRWASEVDCWRGGMKEDTKVMQVWAVLRISLEGRNRLGRICWTRSIGSILQCVWPVLILGIRFPVNTYTCMLGFCTTCKYQQLRSPTSCSRSWTIFRIEAIRNANAAGHNCSTKFWLYLRPVYKTV